MNSKNYYIFVVSNPTSAIHATILKEKFDANGEFILILDEGNRKDSFNNEILTCAGKTWNTVLNLGKTISDNTDLKPSLRKRITRKIKHIWPIKPIYNSLLKKYQQKHSDETLNELKNKLSFISNESTNIHLFLLTQTIANNSLIKLFPNAEINFFEHGLPDYLFSFKPVSFNVTSYYCLFDNEFKTFTEKYRMKGPAIKSLMSKEKYLTYCESIFKNSSILNHFSKKIQANSVLILMQSLEKYELGNEFWIKYIKHITANEKAKNENYQLVLKPHPHQSNEVLFNLSKQLTGLEINHIILNEALEIGFSSEILFSLLNNKFTAVYSPFSYSVYFLSHLFNNSEVAFYDSYDSMKSFIGKAPKQYQEQFTQHEKIIKECFAIQTKQFNF